MADIHEMLERGAGEEPATFTTDDVESRVRRRSRRRRAVGAVAVIAIVAAGVVTWAALDGTDEVPVATDPRPPLEQLLVGEWVATGLGVVAGPVDPLWVPVLGFESDGQVRGSYGCNTFSGRWELRGSTLVTPEHGSTAAACIDATRQALEDHLRPLLHGRPEVSVLDDAGRTIELRSGDRHAIFRKVVVGPGDLAGGTWTVSRSSELAWAPEVEVPGVDRPSLAFKADGTVVGHLICNGFGHSPWSLDGRHLVLDSIVQRHRGCGPEEADLVEFLGSSPRVWWLDTDPDRLLLRVDHKWLELLRSDPDQHEPGLPSDPGAPPFEVLHVNEMSGLPVGTMGAATDPGSFEQLWSAFANGSRSAPGVDFSQQVVVAVVISDDACPPELVDISVQGLVLTPVFRQPEGGCRQPLIPKVFVVALSQEIAPPGSMLAFPEDPELRIGRQGPLALPIWPEEPPPQADAMTQAVELHFSPSDVGVDCSATVPVAREVPAGAPVAAKVALAVRDLLGGPTPEEQADGMMSFFGPATAGALLQVGVEDGVAHVDLTVAVMVDNASTSCGSAMLMSSLTRTVTQFEGVESAVFYLDGDADAFYNWLQSTPPPEARPSG